jgi:hypothetical protein
MKFSIQQQHADLVYVVLDPSALLVCSCGSVVIVQNHRLFLRCLLWKVLNVVAT